MCHCQITMLELFDLVPESYFRSNDEMIVGESGGEITICILDKSAIELQICLVFKLLMSINGIIDKFL